MKEACRVGLSAELVVAALTFVCLSVRPQVEGMDTAPNSATSSAPSSPWRRPVKSTDTASSRWGEVPSEHRLPRWGSVWLHVALHNSEDEEKLNLDVAIRHIYHQRVTICVNV